MTEQQQTPNLPAIVRDRPMVAAPADTDSWTSVVGEVAKLAQYVADTEFVPKGLRGNAPAAAAAILYGREIGLPPMTALNGVYIVDGSPSLAAEQMRSLVLAAGHDLEFVETTGTICKVRGRRRGSETWTTVEWSIDMARAAGLTTKKGSVWQNYPRRMLQARASSELCELVFPDVIHGFRSLEAQQDAADEQDTTAAAAAPRATTRVRRTRTASPAAETLGGTPAPATAAKPSDRGSAPSIPLPGEDGYDSPQGSGSVGPARGDTAAVEPTPTAAGVAGDAGPDPDPPETSGEGTQPSATRPSPDPQPDTQAVDGPVDEQDPDYPNGVTDAEIVGEEPPPAAQPLGGIRPAQNRMILAKFNALGVKDRDDRIRLTSQLIGHPVTSTKDLTKDDASTLIDTLALCNSLEQLRRVAADTEAAETPPDGDAS